MNKAQTDNTNFLLKVNLRMQHLPEKETIEVLDLFSGDGLIWNEINLLSGKNINTLRIDVKENKQGIYLKGNNLKFLKSLNLDEYDIIDLDAYGIPYNQLKEILSRKFKGIIFITYIQSVFGKLHKQMLIDLNYTQRMIRKAPTLFDKNGIDKLKNWLSLYGIKKMKRYTIEDRKHYIVINY